MEYEQRNLPLIEGNLMCQPKNVFDNYIDNVCAYVNKINIRDVYTGEEYEPDEKFMIDVESHCGIDETLADDFRRQIVAMIGMLVHRNKTLEITSNPKLHNSIKNYVRKQLIKDRKVNPEWLCANDGAVLNIIKDKNWPILADALEDAGFSHQDLLDHLRNCNEEWCAMTAWLLNSGFKEGNDYEKPN